MRPVRVVVLGVDAQHPFEMTAADDQQPVEALPPQAPDPALGVRPRPRRPHRRLDDTDAVGTEHLVEVARELAISVADQVAHAHALVVEAHHQVARLLGDPGRVRVGGDTAEPHTPARQLDRTGRRNA